MVEKKNAIIFHGTGETPQSFWYPYVKEGLEKKGYRVSVPQLPGKDIPDLKEWLPAALKEKYDFQTVIIGHSAGCPLTLSVLQNIDSKVRKAILVAGFVTPLKDAGDANKILQKEYDWNKIKENVEQIIFINSDNDPWGCDDKQGRKMFDNLGGTLIIRHGEGHMGSNTFNQPYKEFPLLVKLATD